MTPLEQQQLLAYRYGLKVAQSIHLKSCFDYFKSRIPIDATFFIFYDES